MGGRIRIVSANLWNGAADPDAFAALLQRLEVDAVGLQELGPAQAEAISRVLPYGLLEPSTCNTGMGIALRRPAVVDRVPMSFRDIWRALPDPAAWPELPRTFELLAVHIAAPHVRPYGSGPRHRRRQMATLDRYLLENAAAPRALIGDFNATPSWPVYRRISSHLTDAAVAAAQRSGGGPAATWGPWSGAPRLLRIDHGFTSVTVEDFRVVDIAGSDHSAIVMDLSSSS